MVESRRRPVAPDAKAPVIAADQMQAAMSIGVAAFVRNGVTDKVQVPKQAQPQAVRHTTNGMVALLVGQEGCLWRLPSASASR